MISPAISALVALLSLTSCIMARPYAFDSRATWHDLLQRLQADQDPYYVLEDPGYTEPRVDFQEGLPVYYEDTGVVEPYNDDVWYENAAPDPLDDLLSELAERQEEREDEDQLRQLALVRKKSNSADPIPKTTSAPAVTTTAPTTTTTTTTTRPEKKTDIAAQQRGQKEVPLLRPPSSSHPNLGAQLAQLRRNPAQNDDSVDSLQSLKTFKALRDFSERRHQMPSSAQHHHVQEKRFVTSEDRLTQELQTLKKKV